MKTVYAVYENEVFRSRETVHLPEHREVEFETSPVPNAQEEPDMSGFLSEARSGGTLVLL